MGDRRQNTVDWRLETGVRRQDILERNGRWETGDRRWGLGDGEGSLTSYPKNVALII